MTILQGDGSSADKCTCGIATIITQENDLAANDFTSIIKSSMLLFFIFCASLMLSVYVCIKE